MPYEKNILVVFVVVVSDGILFGKVSHLATCFGTEYSL